MASLAALLLLVAWNMSEVKHFWHMVRVAPKSDVAVLLTCYFLTVVFDMVIAVSVGIVLAALLFMRRMAEVAQVRIIGEGHAEAPPDLPPGVLIYDISGPLFFGAAQKAIGALGLFEKARTVILELDQVPAMDATGLVALESALAMLKKRGCLVVIAGLQEQPRRLLAHAGIADQPGVLLLRPDLQTALRDLSG
jgi:SulP family sulfate permease